jgi:hypothetical protein
MRSPYSLCPLRNLLTFYAVRVESEQNRQLVILKTYCLYYEITLLSALVYMPSHFLGLRDRPTVSSISLLGNGPSVCCRHNFFLY